MNLAGFHIPDCAENSYLVSFEGIEGSGKSTQVEKFIQLNESKKFNVKYFREPGGTDFGEKLRNAILESTQKLEPLAEAMLFASARAQLLFQFILPELKNPNTIVVLDRYIDSSIAYQGHARKLGHETIIDIHRNGILTNMPHVTFYLKIDYATSQARQLHRGNNKDYFEKENKTFYENLIAGYDKAAEIFKNRILIIDANKEIDQVKNQIKDQWENFLNAQD